MIPNVKNIRGLLYYRRQVGGKRSYIRLPALDDPEFWPAYNALAKPADASEARAAAPVPGSLAALVADFRGSSDFKNIPSARTRTNYLRYLDMIATEHGTRLVHQVRPVHVYKMRDKMAETPGKANNWLTVFRTLMSHAARRDWRADNPARDIKALPIGEHEPWPADLLRVCLEAATPMTRLLIVTGLCSGQRVGDVIRMHYNWIEDGVMSFRQSKTGADVSVPLHPFWIAELARLPRRSTTLLYDRFGRPFGTTGAVQSRMRDLMAMAEVQEVMADLIARETVAEGQTFVFHGLRKNACCYLLETGKNDSEVGAMLGMSAAMVRHYGKRSRALMIAKTAAAEFAGGKVVALPGVNVRQSG